jgi:hypothetical protein
MIAIPEKSTFDILVDEILNPFNLFQVHKNWNFKIFLK